MCEADYCPCSYLDSSVFGSREGELADKIFTGSYSSFDQCYDDLVAEGTISRLPDSVLELVSYFENNDDCAGLCNIPLFYFYNDINYGPPPNNCYDELVVQI
mmetsp:Transcript_27455/g.26531  ORF Transcript_27455/g.26531 Transcript_27455/m.26531 type:complete len:102 (+) Transcript_27455:479-784(+)